MCLNHLFLSLEQNIQHWQLQGRMGYFGSQFTEISDHSQLAPRQDSMAQGRGREETTNGMAVREESQGRVGNKPVQATPVTCPFCANSNPSSESAVSVHNLLTFQSPPIYKHRRTWGTSLYKPQHRVLWRAPPHSYNCHSSPEHSE